MRMSGSCEGVLFMLSNAFMISLGGLSFRYSGFQNDCVASWIGLLGAIFGAAMLCADKSVHKKHFNLLHNHSAVISLLNGALLGGSSIYFFGLSLHYIIPSDTLIVKFFQSILTSVILEVFKVRKRPSLASLLSIVFGLLGTIFICKPKSLFSTETFLESQNSFLGVGFASLSGLNGSLFYFILRNLDCNIPDSWHFLWFMVGSGLFGSITYRPLSSGGQGDCVTFLRSCAIMASVTQVGCGITAIKSVKRIVPSAAFVLQLFSTAITFIFQLIIFPGILTWTSTVGTILVIISVSLQIYAVRTSKSN